MVAPIERAPGAEILGATAPGNAPANPRNWQTLTEYVGTPAWYGLLDDIEAHGVQVPVEVDEFGAILDGHHRVMAAKELGIGYPTIVRRGLTDAQKRAHVVRLNVHRRQISAPQRDALIAELRAEGVSTRAIAQQVGLSQSTVQRSLSREPNGSPAPQIAGKDGKTYPAPMPSVAPVKRVPVEIKLSDWKQFEPTEQHRLLDMAPVGLFNRQENDSIGWAEWSWNPVTGCLHGCTYCYARDIAERFYTHGFVPVLHPERIRLPDIMRVPAQAELDVTYRNVFVCSMADLFGKWVPTEWIDAVLAQVRKHPEWNFLFLTKFPDRLLEFDFPDNAWVGTSVDIQARVPIAERAFAKVRAKVKWLSCEPLLEPLKFSRLDLFDWIVIGGATKSNEVPATPEFKPPWPWIRDLMAQMLEAGVEVYFKGNLSSAYSQSVTGRDVPAEFHMAYLKSNIDEVRELPSHDGTLGSGR